MMNASRRGWSAGCLGTAWLVVCAPLLPACGATARPRSLLIVTLDTMRADRLPPYGAGEIVTPALTRLATGGALFEQAFASSPLTLPSHASLFTGRYPQHLGLRDNAGDPLGPDVLTLAELFRREGFRTAAVVASAVLAPGRGLDAGFDTYDMAGREGCGPAAARRDAGQIVDAGLRWLAETDGAPFFLWLHLYDTHRPYQLPPDYVPVRGDPYSAAIAYEDGQLARVIDYLEKMGQLDDTLIVVAGDHGESLGDHGEDTHGIFVYQEALHVPLILRGPGIRPQRVGTITRLVDVVPTLLDLFRLQAIPGVDGVTLLPDLTGKTVGQSREVYAESLYPLRFGWGALRSLRADRYKFIDAPKPELYDLATDPQESRNIVRERSAVAEAMRDRLRAFDGNGTGNVAPVAPELAARLAAVGYLSGAPDRAVPGEVPPDPKDRIEQFNEMMRAQARHIELRRAIDDDCWPEAGARPPFPR